MKKIVTMVAIALSTAIVAEAQTIYDGSKFTDRDLNGTARFVGMGGAMGALGGDISTMGVNPAGIGIYRSNDFMGTIGFSSYGTKSDFLGNSFSSNSNRFTFDNVGFVLSTKVGNQTSLRYVNFGFNYKKSKSFYKNMSMSGLLNTVPGEDGRPVYLTQLNQIAGLANQTNANLGDRDVFYNTNVNWLSALGWNGNLLDRIDGRYYPLLLKEAPRGKFLSEERGGIDQYDLNLSFNFNDRFYLGATFGIYDVNYDKYSSYDEAFERKGNGGYRLESWNNIGGTGYNFKLGAIVRPFESSPLRLGFAIHTPTFYRLTLSTGAILVSDLYYDDELETRRAIVNTYDKVNGDMRTDYRLHTPWKFNASLGYTVGNNFAFGAEYEHENYSTMKFYDDLGYAMDSWENATVKDMLKAVNTFRVGVEYKVVPQFAVRAGYNYSTTAFEDHAYKDIHDRSILTDTDYSNTKGISNYTLGLGYRGNSFYADLAYKYNNYEEDFYPFYDSGASPTNDLAKTKVTNNNHQLLLTLGFRF